MSEEYMFLTGYFGDKSNDARAKFYKANRQQVEYALEELLSTVEWQPLPSIIYCVAERVDIARALISGIIVDMVDEGILELKDMNKLGMLRYKT